METSYDVNGIYMDDHVWQIGICGTFDVQNYGDLLFPLLAEFELTKRLGPVRIHPFSYYSKTPPAWPFQVSSLTELPEAVDRLDGVLIGGGHIVRFDKHIAPGYEPPTRDLHHPTGYWLTPALMAQQAGVPTVWNAPGVYGDFPTWSEPLLTLAFRESPYVAVRDESARQALARFANEITVTPDTAFGVASLLDGQRGTDASRHWRETLRLDRPYVIVQATNGLESFSRLVRNHPEVLADYRLVVIPIGPVLGDRNELVMADLLGAVSLPTWPDPVSLAALIGRAEAAVGTSMHLAITALSCGVPVFRPAHCFDGKYGVLADFDTVYGFDAGTTIDPVTFSARLGRRKPSAQVQVALERLTEHWNRIADVITRGRQPVTPAFLHYWQTLPTLLEGAGEKQMIGAEGKTRDRLPTSLLDSALPTTFCTQCIKERKLDMLNLAKIESTKLEAKPFGWAMIGDLFSRRDADALSSTYPRDNFKTVTGNDGEKSYHYEARSLIGMGVPTVSHESGLAATRVEFTLARISSGDVTTDRPRIGLRPPGSQRLSFRNGGMAGAAPGPEG